MTPWLAVAIITFFTLFGIFNAHDALCLTSDRSELEKGLCAACQRHSGLETFLDLAQVVIPLVALVFGMALCAKWNEGGKIGAQVALQRY